ncbi:hypothetical protein ND486_11555 [Pseudonocardia sp. DR1-2]|uniref:hypothetical protein n=1 Tax=Pseudonocardia sp. DR1-2 TaxID=2951168 RepID=UPI002043767E|nr:hypothetical protein [Pseudonocardia sp. DR1-2]MCM3846825.1 hypothetical protein [Pseudonocardia sp. DR1-2]
MLHLILTVITFGMWAFVWIIMVLAHKAGESADQTRYSREYEQYRIAYHQWQTGQPPGPAPRR